VQSPPPFEETTITEPADRLSRWRQMVVSLRYRDYRLLWTTSFLSSAARTIQQISIGWLAFDLTGSALLLGSVLFIYQFPSLFTAPLVGVLVDRLDRRRILIASQIAMALVAVALAADIALGMVRPWHLFVFALVSGLESTLIHVVRQALIPALVPPHALMNAIALHSAGFTVTRIGAPFLGGVLIVSLGVTGNFLLQALLLVGVAAAAFPLRIPPELAAVAKAQQEPFMQALAEGLRYVWSHGAIRLLFTIHFVVMFLSMPFTNFLPVWAADVLHMEADGLGVLYTVMGVGALIGTLALASAGNMRRKGVLLIAASAGLSMGLLGLGWASWLPASLLMLALLGAIQTVYFAVSMTLVQSRIPARLQGRVMSIYNLGHGTMALGTLLMGALADLIGVQWVAAGMGAVLLALTAVAVPTVRQLETPTTPTLAA
jgi:MFS family permease